MQTFSADQAPELSTQSDKQTFPGSSDRRDTKKIDFFVLSTQHKMEDMLEKFAFVTQAVRTTARATVYGDEGWLVPPLPEEYIHAPNEQFETSLGDFEVVGEEDVEEESDELLPFTRAERQPEITKAEWESFFDEQGSVKDVDTLKKRLFYGGLEPSLRKEAWKFLLGYFPFASTHEQREEIKLKKAVEYTQYKLQWETITEEQETHHQLFRERKINIQKDVVRTDRHLEAFADTESAHLSRLNDILLTYSFFNFDLGYVQGMNDLLAPIMLLMDDEADSFWCFKGLMDQMEGNFQADQLSMRAQLAQLAEIIKILDPRFYAYLERRDCLHMFFCFRWILINFKREFEYHEAERIWEVTWSGYLTKYFPLFIAASILLKARNQIITAKMGFDEILKYTNSLTGQLAVEEVLVDAEFLFHKCLLKSKCTTQQQFKDRMAAVEAKIIQFRASLGSTSRR
jgi:hypothetical protein